MVYKRLLVDPQCRDKILEASERDGKQTVWNSVYKPEAIVKKCGKETDPMTVHRLRWVVMSVSDLIDNKDYSPGQISVRSLNGRGQPQGKGIIDFALFQYELKTYVASTLATELKIPTVVIDRMSSHEEYRKWFGFKNDPTPRKWLANYDEISQNLYEALADTLECTISTFFI